MIQMNIKQTAKEATISDSTFIFPIVDGLGRPVEKLTPDKEYRLIRRSCYCVLMEDSEVEVSIPDFLPISGGLTV